MLSVIIFLPFVWVTWHSQIIDEKLTCYSDYNCKIETTRFFNIKKIKNLKISPLSKMTYEYTYKSRPVRGRGLLIQYGNLYYIMIDDNKIFNFPVCSVITHYSEHEAVCKPFIDSIIKNFDKYRENNLYNDYTLISSAKNSNCFWHGIITGLVVWSILICVFFNESDYFKKLKKKKKKSK